MQTTNNLGLKKPEGTDIVDIADLNGNMDTLDSAVKSLQDHAADTHRHITDAERTQWNAKETTAGSQAKANAAAAASVPLTQKGTANGVATLDASAKLPAGQLPATAVRATTADVTYYVRTDGNDSNNGLANTAAGAFRTIGKAISMIPTVVNHKVDIMIANGTYSEDVLLHGFTGYGQIRINPSATVINDSCIIQSLTLDSNAIAVIAQGVKASRTSAYAFSAKSCINAAFLFCKTDTASSYDGLFVSSAKVYIYGSIISNRNKAVNANQNAEVFTWDLSGTGNIIALYSGEGSRISTTGSVPSGTTQAASGNGGTLTTGVINPWGDNTYNSRPFGSLNHTPSTQTISASVWTKINLTGQVENQRGICDASNARFVIPETGIYLLTCRIGLGANGSNLTGLRLGVYLNGTRNMQIAEMNGFSSTGITLSGSSLFSLSTGTVVEIYAYTDQSATISQSGEYSHVSIIRVA
ncbi:hypothetical protein SAMN04487895_12829 [Paenibacillus sophorae]|uniref:C1q domain-containing protein n=1 Tax=Paenibacillus sophorae TaxID=1333845 RepID=A0A1H8VW40_9BACL|nr:hypothetical protein [Paenibacillus sophorae]QWU15636.1 hypothetical protein KP014_28000 [Paenibacillus sophorae]SEP19540.1 hypothetical protein SAMN04487895_12829 [Paenibacillus sophorae]